MKAHFQSSKCLSCSINNQARINGSNQEAVIATHLNNLKNMSLGTGLEGDCYSRVLGVWCVEQGPLD